MEEQEAGVRSAFRDAILARIDRARDEPNYHLFSLDVREAGFIRFGDAPLAMAWDDEAGFREVPHPDAS